MSLIPGVVLGLVDAVPALTDECPRPVEIELGQDAFGLDLGGLSRRELGPSWSGVSRWRRRCSTVRTDERLQFLLEQGRRGARAREPVETGHGCPVHHVSGLDGEEKSSALCTSRQALTSPWPSSQRYPEPPPGGEPCLACPPSDEDRAGDRSPTSGQAHPPGSRPRSRRESGGLPFSQRVEPRTQVLHTRSQRFVRSGSRAVTDVSSPPTSHAARPQTRSPTARPIASCAMVL